jgi:hypothetical protein
MPWRHCVKVKKKPIAAGKARRPRRHTHGDGCTSPRLSRCRTSPRRAGAYSRSSCMRVSQDRLLLHLLRLRGQRAGMATDCVGKLRRHVIAEQRKLAGEDVADSGFGNFFYVTERLMRAEGCLLHAHRRMENLHRAAAAGSNVKIRGHIMTAEIDHRPPRSPSRHWLL